MAEEAKCMETDHLKGDQEQGGGCGAKELAQNSEDSGSRTMDAKFASSPRPSVGDLGSMVVHYAKLVVAEHPIDEHRQWMQKSTEEHENEHDHETTSLAKESENGASCVADGLER
ncbi:unnamed protein product [Ostreobium quekettii]|uniref:Uncharacterized protein n=1 Tax=Ostreobium quekettii TaxID=121088 RepID=A0A8S1J4P6_9CHLO|nr:unnamed protein product [Ostreobium quekettii]